jgi:hypothetical protein
MENRKIRIVKLKEVENAKHPNNIKEGFAIEGEYIDSPCVGGVFWVGNFWRTSIVQEVLDDNKFRTLNSIYQFTFID